MLSKIVSRSGQISSIRKTQKPVLKSNILKRTYAKAKKGEAEKFVQKNSELFSTFVHKYSDQKFSSLEEAATYYYGDSNAAEMESRFLQAYNTLKDQALGRYTDSEYFVRNPRQSALVREYVTADKELRTKLEKKYNTTYPTIFKYNITNDMLGGSQEPLKIAITGAAGAIGYSLAYRIASGNVFGPTTPVELQLLELPNAMGALEGVVMELHDCAFPLLKNVVVTSKPEEAFEGVDYALLVGSKPRGPGMERGDLLQQNAEIFRVQGKALNKAGKGKDTRVLVVGNPANTNCLIAQTHAKSIPRENFTAMTRLDHNRGLAQLANKLNVRTDDIENFAIWGNHSATQFPDVSHAVVGGEKISSLVDQDWLVKDFIPVVQQRGAAIIKARGASSAASAASACLDGLKDWHLSTFGSWTSAAVCSKGDYGITEGLFYSYPVTFSPDKQWSVVKDLPIDEFARERMEITHKELLEERDAVSKLL